MQKRKSKPTTKDTSQHQEVTAKTQSTTVLAVGDGSNPWIEVSAELDRFVGAPFLKFNKQGEFCLSDTDVVPNGTRCIAHVDECSFGWRKWEGGKPVDERMGRVADCFVPPQRSALGDADERQWETDADTGDRRDPWQLCASVPFTRLDTGESYLFAVSSKGGLRCINGLIRSYGNRVRQKGKDVGLPHLSGFLFGFDWYRLASADHEHAIGMVDDAMAHSATEETDRSRHLIGVESVLGVEIFRRQLATDTLFEAANTQAASPSFHARLFPHGIADRVDLGPRGETQRHAFLAGC
jgi:hypothetical protein